MQTSDEQHHKRDFNINQFNIGDPSKLHTKLKTILLWLFTTRFYGTTFKVFLESFGITWGLFIKEKALKRFKVIKSVFIHTIGIDGYDISTGMLTCADGETVPFKPSKLTLTLALASFFGLPSRPETLINGIPQYSFLQFLRNMIGGWNPLKETFEGYEVDEKGQSVIRENGYSIIGKRKLPIYERSLQSFYQWRWTQKKLFIILSGIIRIPVFIVYNVVSWPFRIIRNILKIGTEIFLPLISGFVVSLNMFPLDYAYDYFFLILKPSLRWVYQIPLFIFFAGVSLIMAVAQYALSFACRMGLAFTSPFKSALWAYHSGTEILGPNNIDHPFSIFVGVLGFVLSMALTITLYTIVSPLALGALVAAVPALLAPITWISQVPFIASTLAWFSQLPFVLSMGAAFNTAFGVVGAGLTAAFGPAITALATLINVAIPQVVLTAGIVFGVIIVPAATFITWGVETLSNLLIQWVEQRPIHAVFEWLSNFGSKKSDGYNKLQEHQTETAGSNTASETLPGKYRENNILLYQQTPGGKIVVSKEPVKFVKKNTVALAEANNAVPVIGISEDINPEAAQRIWNRATSGTDASVRMATNEEIEASRNNIPVVFNAYTNRNHRHIQLNLTTEDPTLCFKKPY